MSNSSTKFPRTGRHLNLNEGLIFERSSPGRTGYDLPRLDVPPVDLGAALGADNLREPIPGFPEVSEVDVVRHFTRLAGWNYSIDAGMYPLGSCTMKYNPRLNERVAGMKGLAEAHPLSPESLVQGCLEVLRLLADCLAEISGMDAVSLQPPAGASGELTGILMIRACLSSRGNPRRKVLIPDSAHGTNPASAVIAGYEVQSLKSDSRGCIDLDGLERAMNDEVAALMLTNPNTLGIFEQDIVSIARIVHDRGGLVYMDGANLNALMGITRPGSFGVDVLHINLHKTFSTPHGGGGPGAGPVAVKRVLEPFLPVPTVERRQDGRYFLNHDRPHSIGRVKAFYGNFLTLVRALAYILANGAEGLKQASQVAILNANYIKHHLRDVYDLPYDEPILHEVVFSSRRQTRNNLTVMDLAKRLMDYGFHPPTVAFPLIVQGALMIEPSETESRQELDEFIQAMRCIAEEADTAPDLLKQAPHSTRVSRLNEVRAARRPVLRWKPEETADPDS
ncbi:MAG: aminomethyl-transferring glycine dehydrogenase subunit GcvPB [Acidobacteria bacterium]|nr:aminomethyl-transferring glycine dehydrogenase subunit GcvPB [Acidobacteriota bacterium]